MTMRTLGLEGLESRVMLTTLAGVTAAARLKMGWLPLAREVQTVSGAKAMPLAAYGGAVAVGGGAVLDRGALAENGVLVRRSRPAAAIAFSKQPKPADGITVPSLPGSTKTVEMTIGSDSGKTANAMGLNVGSMTAYAQGNGVNNLVVQGGGFELSDTRVIVHAAAGGTLNTVVVNDGWTWGRIGYSGVIGSTLAGSTGVNKTGTWTIVGMRDELDGNGNATGRAVITVSGTLTGIVAANDTFFVEMTGMATNPLANAVWVGSDTTVARTQAAAHGGSSSVAFTFGSGAGDHAGALTYWFGAEGGAGANVLRQGHLYQMSFWAKTAVGGSTATLDLAQGKNSGKTTVNLVADGVWHQYSLNLLATEALAWGNGQAKITVNGGGAGAVYADDVKMVDLTDADPTGSTLSKETVALIKEYGFGELRFWHPEFRYAKLDDLIGRPEDRPMVASPWDDYDPQFGLPEMLQMAKETGSVAWIVLPTTWTAADAHNLLEYLGGGVETVYGAKRAADGHAASWFSDLKGIRLEAGNESWNGIFSPNAYVPFEPYWERAEDLFHDFKSDALYGTAGGKLELVVNGWQWVPWYTGQSIYLVPDADAVSVSSYTSGPNTQMALNDLLGGVLGQQLQDNAGEYGAITKMGKKVYVYEEAAGELQGTVSADLESAYATSLGAGLAVMRNAMALQRDYGMNVQNLFTMYQMGNNLPNGFALGHYGLFANMMTAETNPRPVAQAAKLLNQATGNILTSSVSAGWVVDSASTQAVATTTQAADAMVTFDGKNLVVTMFNNTVADEQNTLFHFQLPGLLGGKTFTADWSKATFNVLNGPSVGSNNETVGAATTEIAAGKYGHSAKEVYAALPGHAMGSMVIPVTF